MSIDHVRSQLVELRRLLPDMPRNEVEDRLDAILADFDELAS